MVGKRIGNYRVIRQLGEGGMGVVYEAVHNDIGGRAAVKVLRPEFALHPETASRFFNEARAANLIDHPSIVKIFDYGQLPDGAPYLAMELLIGESLHHRLLRERRLSEPDSLRLGRQVATALAAAHDKEVIHRDLKPENIFIVPDAEASGGERAKILDFGIAKLAPGQLGNSRTATNAVMGTPIYMSPEQCKGGKHVDARADVYALGVILFEMLSGRPPFIADEVGEYIGMHLFKDPPPLGSLMPSVSQALQRLVDSMLVKDPQKRPSAKVVTAVLKSLGNLTSDVASRRALEFDAADELPTRLAVPPRRVSEPVTPKRRSSEEIINRREKLSAPRAENKFVPAAPSPGAAASDSEEPTAMMVGDRVGVRPGRGGSGLPEDWQPVVLLAANPTLGSLNPDSGRLAIVEKRKPSALMKRLRRLRFQVKNRVLLWLGLSISDPRTTPSELQKADLRIAIGLAAAALLLVAVGLLVRHGRKPDEQPTYQVQPPLPKIIRKATPPPPAPKPAPDQPLPERLAVALATAKVSYDGGNWVGAFRQVRDAAKKDPHPTAWTVMGQYACRTAKLERVEEALVHLKDDSPASQKGYAEVTSACAEAGLEISPKSR